MQQNLFLSNIYLSDLLKINFGVNSVYTLQLALFVIKFLFY